MVRLPWMHRKLVRRLSGPEGVHSVRGQKQWLTFAYPTATGSHDRDEQFEKHALGEALPHRTRCNRRSSVGEFPRQSLPVVQCSCSYAASGAFDLFYIR